MADKEFEAAEMSVVHLEEETTDEGKLLKQEGKVQEAAVIQQEQSKPAAEKSTTAVTGIDVPEDSGGETDGCGTLLMILSVISIIIFFPFSLLCALKMVQEYERAVIFRLGRILHGGAKGPGLFFVFPCVDTIRTVDLRTHSYDINPQEILTKDHVTVTVDAVVYLRIINPILSITKIDDVVAASKMLGATTLRNVLGTYNMTEILSKRDSINATMKALLDDATDPWGVDVERVELTDVRLPEQLQRAMAAEAEATREARAKVIAAEGEQKSSRALKEAADVMMESPAAMQLRYLQTLNTISAEKNSTIIFPLPMEFLQTFSAITRQPTSINASS